MARYDERPSERIEHPWAVGAIRLTLYLGAAAALSAVFLTTLGFLGFLVAVGGVAVVLNADAALGVATLGVVGVGLSVALSVVAAYAVRRVDRAVVAAARRPDPVERLKRRYVAADIDELEFERRLDRLLDPRADGASLPDASAVPGASRSHHDARECDRV